MIETHGFISINKFLDWASRRSGPLGSSWSSWSSWVVLELLELLELLGRLGALGSRIPRQGRGFRLILGSEIRRISARTSQNTTFFVHSLDRLARPSQTSQNTTFSAFQAGQAFPNLAKYDVFGISGRSNRPQAGPRPQAGRPTGRPQATGMLPSIKRCSGRHGIAPAAKTMLLSDWHKTVLLPPKQCSCRQNNAHADKTMLPSTPQCSCGHAPVDKHFSGRHSMVPVDENQDLVDRTVLLPP